jgi:hypothetical protein
MWKYNEDLFDWLRPQTLSTLEDRVLTELLDNHAVTADDKYDKYYIRALFYQRLLSLLFIISFI